MNDKVSKYVADWFLRGDDDLNTVQRLLETEGIPNIICFHAQQAAEKYLKAFLAYHERHVRKIHDLEALLEACVKVDSSFESLRNDAHFLTQFYPH